MVMATLIISISSDSSDESVGSVMSRVILFGTILTEIPVVPTDLPIVPEVTAFAVASPTGALKPESHSSSETDPSESPLPPVPVAPMVPPFLCSNVSKSEPTAVYPERYVSSAAHNVMVGRWRSRVVSLPSAPSESPSFSASSAEIPTISPVPAPSTFVTLATDIISPIDAPPGPLPSHRLALRYTSHHSSSDNFTLDSPLDSSSDSSSNHSLSDHSLSDHSSEDSIEEDIDSGVLADVGAGIDVGVSTKVDEGISLDVEPFREEFPDLVSTDGSLEVMQLGLDVAMQQLYDHKREIPVDRIVSIETG
ncbi:hypothetical protein Tco_1485810 [Tanacetum coccineum]